MTLSIGGLGATGGVDGKTGRSYQRRGKLIGKQRRPSLHVKEVVPLR